MENNQHNFKMEILEKIQKGELKMRPKAFFLAKIITLAVVVFVTFVVSVFLVSYTLFNLKTGGHIFLLGFGGRGFFEFFLLFPWVLLLIDVALILFLDWLLKQFRFAYHNPALYVFIGSLLIVTIFGSVVSMTSFHKNILHMAENEDLPLPVGGFYVQLRRTHKDEGIFRGEVTFISTSSFMMKNGEFDPDSDAIFTVYVPQGFILSSFLEEGDEVFVAGDVLSSGEVKAYGVKKLPRDD